MKNRKESVAGSRTRSRNRDGDLTAHAKRKIKDRAQDGVQERLRQERVRSDEERTMHSNL